MTTIIFTGVLAAITFGLALVALRREDDAFQRALKDAEQQFRHLLPRLMIGVLGAGFLAHLLPRETVLSWFGPNSGLTGTALATLAGALTPGGPVVGYALGAAALKAGADYAQVVAYVTAWSLMTINRMLSWELPTMPLRFVTVRLIVSLPLPFLAAWVTMLLR